MDLYGNRIPPPIHRTSQPSQHELKRPDSVITTSSIVSSDTASQAGDSSTEASGPPSAYAISGLYGNIQSKKVVSRRRTHSGSLGLGAPESSSNVVTNNPNLVPGPPSMGSGVPPGPIGDHVRLAKSNSCTTNATSTASATSTATPTNAALQMISKTHRR